MNDLTLNKETMSSLQIAEITEKEHKSVMRDVRVLSEQVSKLDGYKFVPISYKDVYGREQPMYELTKKECLLLASGYDALLRAKIIDRWEQLETEKRNGGFQIPTTLSGALMLAAKQAEQIESQQKQLATQAPKVLFATAVETSERSCLIAELAKIISQNGVEIGQNRLFGWMRKNGYLCNSGEYYNQPTQRAMSIGLFEIKKTTITKPDGTVLINTTPKVTGKGQIYFVNKFLYKQQQQIKGGNNE